MSRLPAVTASDFSIQSILTGNHFGAITRAPWIDAVQDSAVRRMIAYSCFVTTIRTDMEVFLLNILKSWKSTVGAWGQSREDGVAVAWITVWIACAIAVMRDY